MTTTTHLDSSTRSAMTTADRLIYGLSRYWLLVFSLSFGLYIGLPFLSPVFMQMGWEGPAKAIYLIYSFLCHQLPQRSLFFFGSKVMYSLGEIQNAWQVTINPLILRQFTGNPEMGWKVAWSDRMVSMYTSILLFSWLWWPLRRRLKPLSMMWFVLLLIPIVLDGTTHFIGDLAGIGQGFRDNNAWLASLTNDAFQSTFYVGDALGSFNSWMRLVTGVLFGLGLVWSGFPYLASVFNGTVRSLEAKYMQTDLL